MKLPESWWFVGFDGDFELVFCLTSHGLPAVNHLKKRLPDHLKKRTLSDQFSIKIGINLKKKITFKHIARHLENI